MIKRMGILLLAAILALSGCAGMTKEQMGQIGGGLLGAGMAYKMGGGVLWTLLGVGAGAYFGGVVGKYMDDADRERAARLAQRSFEQPRPVAYEDKWQNANGAPVSSRVTTQAPYQQAGRTCKRFAQETSVYIDGRPETAVKEGIACWESTGEHPQGTWVIKKIIQE